MLAVQIILKFNCLVLAHQYVQMQVGRWKYRQSCSLYFLGEQFRFDVHGKDSTVPC